MCYFVLLASPDQMASKLSYIKTSPLKQWWKIQVIMKGDSQKESLLKSNS